MSASSRRAKGEGGLTEAAVLELHSLCRGWEDEDLPRGRKVVATLVSLQAEKRLPLTRGDTAARFLGLLAHVVGRLDRLLPLGLPLEVLLAAAEAVMVASDGKCALHCVHAFAGLCDKIRAPGPQLDAPLAAPFAACARLLLREDFLRLAAPSASEQRWEQLLDFLAETLLEAAAVVLPQSDAPPALPSLSLEPRLLPESAKLRLADAVC